MEDPDIKYEDLLKKEKADLEKIKLALEISVIRDSKNEPLKWWNKENAKLTVVIILTGFVTFLTNFGVNSIKSNQDVLFKFKEANANHFFSLKDKFAAENDTIIRTSLAQQLSTFTIYNNKNLDSIINSEKKQFGKIYVQLASIKLNRENIQSEKNSDNADFLTTFETAEKTNRNFETDEKIKKETEERLQIKFDSAIKKDPKLNSIILSTEMIEESIIEIIKVEDELKPKNPIVQTSGVKWFKEGYYLQFDNNIRINLDEGNLYKNQGFINVRVCDSSSPKCSIIIADNLRVQLNGTGGEFSFKEKNYRVNLKAIDRAGKNPFNWAAYITLDEWDK